MFRAITHPLDEVTNASASVFAIENVLDFVFLFTVDDDGRRRWGCDTIVMPGAKAINMEHVMDPQVAREFQAIVEVANSFENLEQSELPGAKFGIWTNDVRDRG